MKKLVAWALIGIGLAGVCLFGFYATVQGVMALPILLAADQLVMLGAYLMLAIGLGMGGVSVGGYFLAVQQLRRKQFKLLLFEATAGIVLTCITVLYRADRYWECPPNDSANLVGLGWPLPMLRLGGVCGLEASEAVMLIAINLLFWSAFAACGYYLYRRVRK